MAGRRAPFRTCAWLVALSVSAPVRAEEPIPVSLMQAASEASDRAPDVLAAISRARTARDSGPAAFATPNPRLTLGTTKDSARETVLFYAFLPFFGRRQAAVKTTEALADAADVGIEVARLDARLAVALAWIDLWAAQRTAQIAVSSRARRDRLLEIATERFEAGAVPRLDQIRARADALRQRAEVDALLPLTRATAAQLALLLARDPQSALEAEGALPQVDPPAAVEVLLSKLQGHPVYLAAQASLRAECVSVAAQRRQLWPFIGVQAGASLHERYPINGVPGGPTNDVNAAVLMEFPVYGVPQLKRARAAERAARANLELVMQRLGAGLVQAHAQLEAASRRAQSALREVVPAAQEMSQLALEAYHEGGADMTAAIASEQADFDAQLAAVQADAERARASARLGHALGAQP